MQADHPDIVLLRRAHGIEDTPPPPPDAAAHRPRLFVWLIVYGLAAYIATYALLTALLRWGDR